MRSMNANVVKVSTALSFPLKVVQNKAPVITMTGVIAYENIAGKCFPALRTALGRYNMIYHHIFIEIQCKTNEIHAKSMKITIGFPIGTGTGSSQNSRPKKLGAMNNFGNRFQID